MMPDMETRIRAKAYQIWEAEGKPDGCEDRHWHEAVEQVRAEIAAEEAKLVKTPKAKAEKPATPKAAKPAKAEPKSAAKAEAKAPAKRPAKAPVAATEPAPPATAKKPAAKKSTSAASALH